MKNYILRGTELTYIKCFIRSDKAPEEFDTLKEFYDYAREVSDFVHYSSDSVIEPVWNESEVGE